MKFIKKYGIVKKEPSWVNYGDTDCEHDELGVVSDHKQAEKIINLLNKCNKREGVYFYIKEHRMTEFTDAEDFFKINVKYGIDEKSIKLYDTKEFEK